MDVVKARRALSDESKNLLDAVAAALDELSKFHPDPVRALAIVQLLRRIASKYMQHAVFAPEIRLVVGLVMLALVATEEILLDAIAEEQNAKTGEVADNQG